MKLFVKPDSGGILRILSLLVGLAQPGCSTFAPAIEGVIYDMTGQQVIKHLGNPDRIENDAEQPLETHWIYALEGAKCRISLKANRVRSRPACQTDDRKEYIRDLALFRDPQAKAKEKAKERLERIKEIEAKQTLRRY